MTESWKSVQGLNYSKFISPNSHPRYFARERLIGRLNQSDDYKYTLIQAPEGYGKTSLLADWYGRVQEDEKKERSVAWFRVDANDKEPHCFWINLIFAMDSCWPGIKEAAFDDIDLFEQVNPNQLTLILANYIVQASEKNIQYTLIFNDFESFKLSESEAQFFIFADMLPSNVNIIIASEAYMNNKLIGQDAYCRFSFMGVSELALRKNEVKELFVHNGEPGISATTLDLVYRKSEGWSLALYSILDQVDQGKPLETAIRELSGRDVFLGNNAFAKITKDLPQKILTFLLETAFFESFSAPLCDFVFKSQESQAIIGHLKRVGAFIFPLDKDEVWHRYHYLFAEWLRNEAMSLRWEQIRILNQGASFWYRENNEKLLSAKHAVAASEADFISSLTRIVFNESSIREDNLLDWLFAIEAKELKKEPYFCLLAAWTYAYAGQAYDAKYWLQLVIKQVNEQIVGSDGVKKGGLVSERDSFTEDVDLKDRLDLSTQVIRLKCLILMGDAEKSMQGAKELLAKANPRLCDKLKMILYQGLGEAYETKGDIESAEKNYQKAATIARVNDYDFLVAFSRYQLIHLIFVQGKLSEAERLCREALAECPSDFTVYGALYSMLGRISLLRNQIDDLDLVLHRAFNRVSPDQNIDMFLEACITCTQYYMACGDYDKASIQLALARKAIATGKENPPRGTAPLVYAHQTNLYVKMEDFESVEETKQEYLSLDFPSTEEGYLNHCLAEAQFAAEKGEGVNEAIADLEKLISRALANKYVLAVLEAYILLVRLNYVAGNTSEATRCLKRAIELSRRERIIKVFLDGGESIRLLLVELIGSKKLSYEADKFSRKVIAAFDNAETSTEKFKRDSFACKEDSFIDRWNLTNREGEVLALLTRGMNRKEIASELCASQNTIKTHISHIYEKAEVHSIAELLRKMAENQAL